MPLTLYKYILRDVVKLLVFATVVLSTVIAFGLAIKPLSDGLLGAWSLVKVLMYTLPVALTFSLPFAAALASTLVYFRLAQDNEITAAAAGGVSYMELMTPVAAVGMVLTLVVFLLSNWVVPKFWELSEREIQQDVVHLAIQKLQRKEPITLGRIQIYADYAKDRVPIDYSVYPAGADRPFGRVRVAGVVAGLFDRVTAGKAEAKDANGEGGDALGVGDDETNGEVERPSGGGGVTHVLRAYAAAEEGTIDFFKKDGRIVATMMLTNVTINDPDSGRMMTVARQPINGLDVRSPFEEKPKFMSLDKLQRFAEDPMRSHKVRESKDGLCRALAEQDLLNRLYNDLTGPDAALRMTGAQGQRYRIMAPVSALRSGKLELSANESRPVTVQRMAGELPTQTFLADRATFDVAESGFDEEPRANLRMQIVTVKDPAVPTPNQLSEVTLPMLEYPGGVLSRLRSQEIERLLSMAEPLKGRGINRAARTLDRHVDKLRREITSRLHERAAVAINTMLVLMLGAVMSMKLRHHVPLTIFFWCFMPTVVSFLIISRGQQMISWRDYPTMFGVTICWFGPMVLLGMVVGGCLGLCWD